MPDLDFQVEAVEAAKYSVTPLLKFRLRIAQSGDAGEVHAIALRCQIRIEPARRRYDAHQKAALLEVFGSPQQWGQSLRPMLWTHTSAVVPAFKGSTDFELPVPCTWDFNIAATKYFDALGDDGDIPLCFLFSGTVFHEVGGQGLQAAPISWEKEAGFHLPAVIWRDMMRAHYGDGVWICLHKDVFDRFRQFKVESGQLSWEQALDALLGRARQPDRQPQELEVSE